MGVPTFLPPKIPAKEFPSMASPFLNRETSSASFRSTKPEIRSYSVLYMGGKLGK
ncbi:hypothetical protein KDI_33810 [Dictyobacter arantiisoli]|uniref:Uncharacterized protein n=1 Tax=Dictyobacter arantiisoli TaxID=2014874 RepID=A0A5A5TEQ9_9CHLR|nr:hypothetical protein KDI_33810 [Dictyobacter arantiisoli]